MPVFTSAVCRVFKAMKTLGVQFRGFDAETYGDFFVSQVAIDLERFEFRSKRILIRPNGRGGPWRWTPMLATGCDITNGHHTHFAHKIPCWTFCSYRPEAKTSAPALLMLGIVFGKLPIRPRAINDLAQLFA
jgi:hypothetical protein